MEKHIHIIGSGGYGEFLAKTINGLELSFDVIDGNGVNFNMLTGDYVIIATPNFTHFNLVKAALEADKHVLCEKPLAVTNQEVAELYALAQKKKRYLGVGFVLPNHPFYSLLKELQKDWGEIVNIEVHNHATEGELQPEWYWNKEQSGGWFMISEIHWYQLFFWLTGETGYHAVTGSERIKNDRTSETASVLLNSAQSYGLSVHHKLNMSQSTHWTKVEVYFANGNHAVLSDWVPDSIDFSAKLAGELVKGLPEFIEVQPSKLVDIRGRDERYADMVRFNVEAMLGGVNQEQPAIILAHKVALEAQQSSGAKLDKANSG